MFSGPLLPLLFPLPLLPSLGADACFFGLADAEDLAGSDAVGGGDDGSPRLPDAIDT